jgi:hypothetical protein
MIVTILNACSAKLDNKSFGDEPLADVLELCDYYESKYQTKLNHPEFIHTFRKIIDFLTIT